MCGEGAGREEPDASARRSKRRVDEEPGNQNGWIIQGRTAGGRAVQPLGWRIWGRGGYISQEVPVTGKDWGMQGEASHQVHFDMLLGGKLLPVAITLGGLILI